MGEAYASDSDIPVTDLQDCLSSSKISESDIATELALMWVKMKTVHGISQ